MMRTAQALVAQQKQIWQNLRSYAGAARFLPARSRTVDWFPTLVAAAGNPNITSELLTGKKIGDQTFKVHLDGYNQLDLITGKSPSAGTRFSISPRLRWRRCASMTTSIVSLTSPAAGLARPRRWTGQS